MHSVNPTLKFVTLVGSFIGLLFINDLSLVIYYSVVLILLFLLFTNLSAKHSVLLLVLLFLLFISTATTMIFYGKGKTTLFQWGFIHITKESYSHGLFLGFRALVFALLGLLFTLTTTPVSLFYSLMQQMKLKPKYAYSFMAGIRLIPIGIEECRVIRKALYVRGVSGKSAIMKCYNRIKLSAVSLLVQSIRRAYRIAIAMEAKKFSDSRKRTYYYDIRFTTVDLIFLSCFCLIVVLGVLVTA